MNISQGGTVFFLIQRGIKKKEKSLDRGWRKGTSHFQQDPRIIPKGCGLWWKPLNLPQSVSVREEMLCYLFLQIIDPEGLCKFLSCRLVSLLINGDTNTYVHIQKQVRSLWHLVGAHYAVVLSQGSTETAGCLGRTWFGWSFQGHLPRKEQAVNKKNYLHCLWSISCK